MPPGNEDRIVQTPPEIRRNPLDKAQRSTIYEMQAMVAETTLPALPVATQWYSCVIASCDRTIYTP